MPQGVPLADNLYVFRRVHNSQWDGTGEDLWLDEDIFTDPAGLSVNASDRISPYRLIGDARKTFKSERLRRMTIEELIIDRRWRVVQIPLGVLRRYGLQVRDGSYDHESGHMILDGEIPKADRLAVVALATLLPEDICLSPSPDLKTHVE